MKKTSILIEVDDTVYDLVVAPHKRAKTFSKLAATLLQGYIENDYIRSYAEDTLETMHKASVDALDDILGDMSNSLANMGLYTNELKNTAEDGVNTFGSGDTNFSPPVGQADKEVEVIKEDISQLKEQNDNIMSMLKQLLSNGTVVTSPVESKTALTPKPVVKSTKVIEDKPDDLGGLSLTLVDEEPKETETQTVDAGKTMQALLMGNTYSF